MSRVLSKPELRETIRARRAGLDPAWRARHSAEVQARVLAVPGLAEANMVGLYMATPGEVATDHLREVLFARGCGVCMPAFDAAQRRYGMAVVTPGTHYRAAPFGLREPEAPVWADPAALDCVVVPGVAFDRAGRRVGHGGGHYDRMLAGTRALKIGVAFDFQVFDRVPADAYDIAMDWLVTPTRALDVREGGIC